MDFPTRPLFQKILSADGLLTSMTIKATPCYRLLASISVLNGEAKGVLDGLGSILLGGEGFGG